MIKRFAALIAALAVLVASFALTAETASAKSKCRGDKSQGVCYSLRSSARHLKVVEHVLMENRHRRTITVHCAFTQEISKSFTAGASLTVGAKADIFGLAEVSTSLNLSMSLTQSASRASSVAADITLKRGEKVECQRTYGYLTTRVTETHYTSSSVRTKQYNVSIPISLGVRVIDR